MKYISGINGMEGIRVGSSSSGDRLDSATGNDEEGAASWKGHLMLYCATKSQPASKLGIPDLAVGPLARLELYHREINRTPFDVWHAFICGRCPVQNPSLRGCSYMQRHLLGQQCGGTCLWSPSCHLWLGSWPGNSLRYTERPREQREQTQEKVSGRGKKAAGRFPRVCFYPLILMNYLNSGCRPAQH